MQYRHTPIFQETMQYALDMAKRDKRLSDKDLIKEAKLDCSIATLARFRTADLIEAQDSHKKTWIIKQLDGRYLNDSDAEKLWAWLTSNNYANQAQKALNRFSRTSLYPLRDVANSLASFYGCHESQIKKWKDLGIEEKRWFLYKQSYRKYGCIVKSDVSFASENDEYFEVIETQRSSGKFEFDEQEVIENSRGFAISKTHQIWMFMQEVNSEQPRVFCFYYNQIPTKDKVTHKEEGLSFFVGKIIESAAHYRGEGKIGCYMWRVVLVSEEMDRNLHNREGKRWEKYSNPDLIPFTKEEVARNAGKDFFIPNDILKLLNEGAVVW